jgi:integrase/recombinase XerD
MPALFKPDRPYPLPKDAQFVEHKGKPHARVGGVLYPLSKDGRKYLKPAAKWAADVVFADGTRKRVRFSPNKSAAAMMLAALLKTIENERCGVVDKFAAHRKRPLAEHLADWRADLVAKGNGAEYADLKFGRAARLFDACRFVRTTDLSASRVQKELGTLKAGGLSAQTINHYLGAAKQFCRWLVADRRAADHPLAHLKAGNVKLDRRHDRRELSAAEFEALVAATRTGRSRKGLSGPDRAKLYTVAAYTGLRASELASLTPESFSLTATPPTLAVAAAYSKHRREDTVPVHPALVELLAPWLADRPAGVRLWPGKWAAQKGGGKMLRADLKVARLAWVRSATTDDERTARSQSDFLAYEDSAGRFADFHALRHTFITNLVKADVHPKVAKELARHSTITLTMDRYAHVGLHDTAAAVNKLPAMTPAGSSTGAAPGAADSDNGRERMRAGENTDGSGRGSIPTLPFPRPGLEMKAVESDREPMSTPEKRKGRDSNPRTGLARLRFSRPVHSTALPPFRSAAILLAAAAAFYTAIVPPRITFRDPGSCCPPISSCPPCSPPPPT